MNLEFNSDQKALLDAVERIALDHAARMTLVQAHYELAPALQSDLEAAGVFDAVGIDELGPVAAVAIVQRLARLPQTLELVGSALVLPRLAPDMTRPCAVIWEEHSRPSRWLPRARSVLFAAGDTVRVASIHDDDVEELETPYGYPVGRLKAPEALHWAVVPFRASELRRLWRAGVSAELTGCLLAALETVVAHVRDRRQFGRPLGAFQAVQHRLAHASVRLEAANWLTLQAACSGTDADALTALGYVQQSTPAIIYDLHQFMGAMGLTLEHPLHRWTTRAKMLLADLGGAQGQYRALADATWPNISRHDAHQLEPTA